MRTINLARPWLILAAALLVGVLLAGVAMAQTSKEPQAKPSAKPSAKAPLKQFKMVRSQSAAALGNKCLHGAYATVRVTDAGQGNQNLNITLHRAAKNTAYTVFIIQQPNSPFGVSWYQGDIQTNTKGQGTGHFVGIFSSEVFAVSPGSAKPPKVDAKDANNGVKFNPIHTFHIGVWFAASKGAANAGCSNTVTPFDGDHEAGIQALSTRTFHNRGPLGTIK